MKRTKRLSIEVHHREVTISIAGATLHVQDGQPGAANSRLLCPTCGSPWITIAARANGSAPASADRIHDALHQSGLHAQVSPAGQLWICQRSFEEVKEKL